MIPVRRRCRILAVWVITRTDPVGPTNRGQATGSSAPPIPFFLIAHHDGLQPTQHEVIWSLTHDERLRRATTPSSFAQHHHRTTRPTSCHLQCSWRTFFSKTHGPHVIRRFLGADAPALCVHRHQAPGQYRQPRPLGVEGAPTTQQLFTDIDLAGHMRYRSTGLNHHAGSLLPKLRGVLPALARHKDILPAGPAVPPV